MLIDMSPRQADDRSVSRRRLSLTTTELLELGLYRVGYVTAMRSPGGNVDVTVHGADGLAVARADSIDLAVDLAYQLGLALVPVH